MSPAASLIEIFSAIQGEGINVGTRQIFVRFGGCDLRCEYCDSQHTWQKQSTCEIEQTPGMRDFVTHQNPIELDRLLELVSAQNLPNLHDSISITGGEPLLHAPFLAEFLPRVKTLTKLPIYLETGGHRPQQLERVIKTIDLVGMDIKLPSVSGENHWDAHREFLQICVDNRVEVFIKLIIANKTDPKELRMTAKMVAEIDNSISIFLQPVTPISSSPHLLSPTPDRVLAWQALMKEYLPSIRVVPQTHKSIGQL